MRPIHLAKLDKTRPDCQPDSPRHGLSGPGEQGGPGSAELKSNQALTRPTPAAFSGVFALPEVLSRREVRRYPSSENAKHHDVDPDHHAALSCDRVAWWCLEAGESAMRARHHMPPPRCGCCRVLVGPTVAGGFRVRLHRSLGGSPPEKRTDQGSGEVVATGGGPVGSIEGQQESFCDDSDGIGCVSL